jgi:hypothetical protein
MLSAGLSVNGLWEPRWAARVGNRSFRITPMRATHITFIVAVLAIPSDCSGKCARLHKTGRERHRLC